jgi:hypothetical protein
MAGPLVVVAGALANKPFNGGEAWVRMSWLRGLSRLGCRVAFLEEIAASVCVDACGDAVSPALSVNRRWFDEVMEGFELADTSALYCAGTSISGMTREEIDEVLREADLLINISGNLATPELRDLCRRRVYLDIDPGFTQLWEAAGVDGGLANHDAHLTVGANIGTDACSLPTNGIDWQHVRPPVVLADWPRTPPPNDSRGTDVRFTTVGSWRGPFGPVEWEGRPLGSKVHEFRRFVSLPAHIVRPFEAALAIHPDETSDLELLARHRWSLVDPALVAGTPWEFRKFVRGSSAEFSVAQEMYVATSSGWFSDRSTRYLATGRPVLVQDTGFSRTLPTGKGVVAFTTLAEAVAGAESILGDFGSHAAAARQLAEEYFDSDRVLTEVLERWGLP